MFVYPYLAKINTQTVTNTITKPELEFSIYPNPSKNNIFIDSKDLQTINIYDISGMLVKQLANTNHQIDISNLKAGIYFLKAESVDGEIVGGSFVKQ